MAITVRNPNTIYLGGGDGPGGESGCTVINEYVAGAAITPGMLIEKYNDGGTIKLRPHATADNPVETMVALEFGAMNKKVSDVYPVGDLVIAGVLRAGSSFWGLIPSGQNIAPAARLQSNGDGKFKALAGGAARFAALESSGAVTADTRVRMEVIS